MDTTIENILCMEKTRVCAHMDGKNQFKNIANFGIKKNGIAMVERNGEYHGVTFQILEDIKPLLTNLRIANALQNVDVGDIISAQHTLNVNSPDEVYYVMYKWLEKYKFIIPDNIKKNYKKIKNPELDHWMTIDRSMPLEAKIKVVDIGYGKNKQSVLPESWIGRIFKSGYELHAEMDKLETRKDKPTVHYCCIYDMSVKDKILWGTKNDFIDEKILHAIIIEDGDTNTIEYIDFAEKNYKHWLNKLDDDYDIIMGTKYLIACHRNQFFTEDPQYGDELSMSQLVSQMQKCIRRGSVCSKLLMKTISSLNNSKPHNLPEHNFMRVSGTKQLLWRLFIMTIEDSSIYKCSKNLVSSDLIFALSVICHLDGTLQLNKNYLDKIINTALLIQNYGKHWEWHNGSHNEPDMEFDDNNLKNALRFAILYIPMMKGDNKMLKRSINYIDEYELPKFSIKSVEKIMTMSEKSKELQCEIEAIDMHCYPNIILLIQGSVKPNNDLTTYTIPKIIWDYCSKKNFRFEDDVIPDEYISVVKMINHIQEYLHTNGTKKYDLIGDYDTEIKEMCKQNIKNNEVSENDEPEISLFNKRLSFLLLFGRKIKMPAYGNLSSAEIIIGGTDDIPIKIKKTSTKNKYEYLVGNEHYEYEKHFLEFFTAPLKVTLPNPPTGYVWKYKKSYVYIRISMKKEDDKLQKHEIYFMVDDDIVPVFDCSKLLIKIPDIVEHKRIKFFDTILSHVFYNDDEINGFDINLLMRKIWKIRNKLEDTYLYKWNDYLKNNNIPPEVWRIIYSRLISDDVINIGPVDRGGERTLNAISIKYEGTIWRIMNMLSMLYPTTFNLSALLKFEINKSSSGYEHIINILQKTSHHEEITKIVPVIKTKLWDHQKLSSDKIFDGIITNQRKGHCDASCVGSGKTLVALNVIAKLMEYDIPTNATGALILLPTDKLYNTWRDEINKHTKKFKICVQSANGDIDDDIQFNSIVITTLGRMRDHPIVHNWIYVIIDECLSVQNSSSLHTAEAWRQVTNSKYGVLLLSASFFRSRFDKLLYMLRMLRTGLPEDIEYLDTILNECLVCFIGEKTRKWISNINRFKLPETIRKKYDEILNSSDDYETKYVRLSQLLLDKCDYVQCIKDIINNIGDNRALIYARSKHEADEIADNIKTVSRYPDLKKQHVVVSYTEGTYGLNNLIIFNTIITRPPDADKLPQMMGRLDRPMQKNNILYIEYFLFENTIDEAMIYKLNMAKKFHGHYILPLAEFYKLAIDGVKK